MEAIGVVLLSILSALVGASVTGAILWLAIKRKLVEPQTIFETPRKKRTIIIPGDGVKVLKEKRKMRIQDDKKAWQEEMLREGKAATDELPFNDF